MTLQTGNKSEVSLLHGFALVEALNQDADDCSRPERAQLMQQAAREIESLIKELKSR